MILNETFKKKCITRLYFHRSELQNPSLHFFKCIDVEAKLEFQRIQSTKRNPKLNWLGLVKKTTVQWPIILVLLNIFSFSFYNLKMIYITLLSRFILKVVFEIIRKNIIKKYIPKYKKIYEQFKKYFSQYFQKYFSGTLFFFHVPKVILKY